MLLVARLLLCAPTLLAARLCLQGSGVFYAGYVLFQIPSNLMLNRVGAKIWLPLITAAWGTVATCCIFISSPGSFYALRLALGVAEAGAFPGLWHVCGQVGDVGSLHWSSRLRAVGWVLLTTAAAAAAGQ